MNLNGKKIVVTGSSGFVGKHLCREIINLGGEVIEFDILNGKDVTNFKLLKEIPKFDCMIHLAAQIFVPESYKVPHNFYRTNVQGTLNVCELCRMYNSKLIYPSSYFYGIPEYLPIDESHPVHPHNPYSYSKFFAEELCRAYSIDFSMKAIILRFFNIYGPNQDARFLIPSIIKQAGTGVVNLGDSTPKRDFIHIADVISSYVHSLTLEPDDFEIFNIGSGESYSVAETVDLISKYFPKPFIVNYSEQKRENEVPDTKADIRKARRLMKWEPKISFEQGLKNMIESSGQ